MFNLQVFLLALLAIHLSYQEPLKPLNSQNRDVSDLKNDEIQEFVKDLIKDYYQNKPEADKHTEKNQHHHHHLQPLENSASNGRYPAQFHNDDRTNNRQNPNSESREVEDERLTSFRKLSKHNSKTIPLEQSRKHFNAYNQDNSQENLKNHMNINDYYPTTGYPKLQIPSPYNHQDTVQKSITNKWNFVEQQQNRLNPHRVSDKPAVPLAVYNLVKESEEKLVIAIKRIIQGGNLSREQLRDLLDLVNSQTRLGDVLKEAVDDKKVNDDKAPRPNKKDDKKGRDAVKELKEQIKSAMNRWGSQ